MKIGKRKLYRIIMGSLFPVLYLITGSVFVSLMLATFFLTLLLAMEYERWKHPAVWEYITGKGKGIFREKSGKLTGDTYFILAVFIILFFPKDISIATLFFLVFGDAGSGIIGTKYGRTEIFPGKTLEGLAGGLFFNLIIGLIIYPFLGLSLPLLITGAIVASIVEVLPIKVNDNLSVGIITALIMVFL
ncbi:MAG: hypothetical protein NC905_01635 [Candidatus Omnitrophica bacterium]|nr:hypothetical protein [Candidatus Omnitrophota bacterium]MCM8776954.1 hypothetical protein [Candidatus Omnitrophota bacterium]